MNSLSQTKELSESEVEPVWYVVQSESNRERVAKHYLEAAGFEVYLPMRLCAEKSRASMTPLFPRYMFVRLDMDGDTWPKVFSTIGVAAVITHTTRAGSRPSPIKSAFVTGMREREIDGVLHLGHGQSRGKPLPFNPGDKVKIQRGQNFGELDAVFLERVDANRVLILLSLLGRDSHVVVQARALKGS